MSDGWSEYGVEAFSDAFIPQMARGVATGQIWDLHWSRLNIGSVLQMANIFFPFLHYANDSLSLSLSCSCSYCVLKQRRSRVRECGRLCCRWIWRRCIIMHSITRAWVNFIVEWPPFLPLRISSRSNETITTIVSLLLLFLLAHDSWFDLLLSSFSSSMKTND